MEELKAEYDSIEQREMAATKARIETLRAEIGKKLADAIRAEQSRGVPVSKIAARLGYKSRNTVYTLLRTYPAEEVTVTAHGNTIEVQDYTNFESKRALANWDGRPFTGSVTWNPQTRTAEPKNPLAHEVEAYPEKWSL